MSDLTEVREMYLAEVRRAETAEAELAALKAATLKMTNEVLEILKARI